MFFKDIIHFIFIPSIKMSNIIIREYKYFFIIYVDNNAREYKRKYIIK